MSTLTPAPCFPRWPLRTGWWLGRPMTLGTLSTSPAADLLPATPDLTQARGPSSQPKVTPGPSRGPGAAWLGAAQTRQTTPLPLGRRGPCLLSGTGPWAGVARKRGVPLWRRLQTGRAPGSGPAPRPGASPTRTWRRPAAPRRRCRTARGSASGTFCAEAPPPGGLQGGTAGQCQDPASHPRPASPQRPLPPPRQSPAMWPRGPLPVSAPEHPAQVSAPVPTGGRVGQLPAGHRTHGPEPRRRAHGQQ